MTRPARRHLTSSLRSFLRFCHVRGYADRNLADAIPVISTPKLDRIPRAISWESVQKLLAAPDRTTHAGRRDYAVLKLLATYGVRIGQVTPLKMQDIDWRKHLIRFPSSKHGRELCFPLTHDVAEALLVYIKKTRGKAPFPEVFLTVRGTTRPLAENDHLSSAMQTYFRRAGIASVSKGSHTIRHAG
jgi:integrase